MEIDPVVYWEGMPGVVEAPAPVAQFESVGWPTILVLILVLIVVALGCMACIRWLRPVMLDWMSLEPASESVAARGDDAAPVRGSSMLVDGPTGSARSPVEAARLQPLVQRKHGSGTETAAPAPARQATAHLPAAPRAAKSRFEKRGSIFMLAAAGIQLAIYVFVLFVPMVDYQEYSESWLGMISPSVLLGAAEQGMEAFFSRHGDTVANGFLVARAILSVLALPIIAAFASLSIQAARIKGLLRLEGAILCLIFGMLILNAAFLSPDILVSYQRRGGPLFGFPLAAIFGSWITGIALGQIVARARSARVSGVAAEQTKPR